MRYLVVAILLVTVCGCKTTHSLYDQYAYKQAISVKVDALNVMDLATDSYQLHQKEITDLNTEVQKAYEYDKGRDKDTLTMHQWKILLDPQGHLLTFFLNKWKGQGTISRVLIEDYKTNISNAMNEIIRLEINKSKPKTNS